MFRSVSVSDQQKLQKIQSTLFNEWHKGKETSETGATAVFGKFSNRLQVDTKVSFKLLINNQFNKLNR